jgi:hypothetical protein
MGTLSVERSINGSSSWAVVWTMSGQQQAQSTDDWRFAQAALLQPDVNTTLGCDTLQLRWKGNRMNHYTGDMAIDTIVFGDKYIIRCSCVNGFPEIGDNCPYDQAPYCSACLPTYFLNTLNFSNVSRPFPSWTRSILTEIYLCHACSYHEIEDGNGPDR